MSVTAARGFVAGGVAGGVKGGGGLDLALVATEDGHPVPAAAVFTSNRMAAAPVEVSRSHLQASSGRAAAVLLNSGNANAATGAEGRRHAEQSCAAVADAVGCRPDEVLVCSTGLIGRPLAVDRVVAAVPSLVRAAGREGGRRAAEAILTTDTVAKEAAVSTGAAVVGGMAKGAAMLAPDLATMLAVVTTDAAAEPSELDTVLREAVADSFNALTVDGCTSTNDTVLLLASGAAGAEAADWAEAVAAVCANLALQMAGDAEGATKVVELTVTGAATAEEARQAARKVAESQLVKCSWYGQDPYWGRIVSELGSAGVTFDPDRVSVAYGDVVVAAGGVEAAHDEAALARYLRQRHLAITADLGVGAANASVTTNDLTHAYVDENMGTS